MIDRAIQEFHGARECSWLIGDASVDIETARRAGLKSVLVETGYAGLDYREWATPDATVPDLASAVSFILDQYPRLFAYCRQLAKGIGAGALVLIGGAARSGKSTFASVLRDALLVRGQRASVVSIDRWLKDAANREPGVLGRYDMDAVQSLIGQLENRERRPDILTLPGYHKLHRKQIAAVERMQLSSADVVLIEGTVALAPKIQTEAEIHRYHIVIDEELRKQRVLHEYRLRGHSYERAMDVYLARQADEFPVLERLAAGAIRITPSDALR
jgi:uridine kinase